MCGSGNGESNHLENNHPTRGTQAVYLWIAGLVVNADIVEPNLDEVIRQCQMVLDLPEDQADSGVAEVVRCLGANGKKEIWQQYIRVFRAFQILRDEYKKYSQMTMDSIDARSTDPD